METLKREHRTTEEARERALRKAMATRGGAILAYLTHKTGQRLLAEELYQELWVQVYRTFAVEDFENLRFLYRKAYQVFVSDYRKRQARPQLVLVGMDTEDTAELPHSRETAGAAEEARLARDFWETFAGLELSALQKEAFWLSARYGFTVREIAEKLRISKTRAGRLITDVKARCAQHLNETATFSR